MKTREIIYKHTYSDGVKTFNIAVPIIVHDYLHGGMWTETIPLSETKKIEMAIEKKCPGFFHRCVGKNSVSKSKCPACKRLTKQKSLVV